MLSFILSIVLIVCRTYPVDSTFVHSPTIHTINTQTSRYGSNIYVTMRRSRAFNPSLKAITDNTVDTEKDGKGEVHGLSDLDARVLQSLLEDKSLDLKSEENLRKMLTSSAHESSAKKEAYKVETTSSNFSSTLFKTFDNNEIWNSLSAKAESFMESAKIFIQNRIDRDAKLLATIGVFAWQRAMKDVGRALPSAGKSGAGMAKKMRDSLFLLANNSSYVPYIAKDNFILPPSKYSAGVERGVYEELNTPMDEIKSVTEAIRNILAGKAVSEQQRGLNSVARAGVNFNAERQKMAFERRKKTVLKREKEGFDAKVLRATSTLTDTAWELKREIEVEGNEAGYRAKRAQKQLQGTLNSVGLLGGAETKSFRGMGERLFGNASSINRSEDVSGDKPLDVTIAKASLEVTASDLETERRRVFQGLCDCLDNPSESWLGATFPTREHDKDEIQDMPDLPHYASPVGSSSKMTSANENLWEQLITTMVLTRDDIEAELSDNLESYEKEEEIIEELQKLEKRINIICSQATASAGPEASQSLLTKLKGREDSSQPSILWLIDDIIDQRNQRIKTQNDTSMQDMIYNKNSYDLNGLEMEKIDVPVTSADRSIPTLDDSEIISEDSNDRYETVVVSEVVPGDVIHPKVSNARSYSLADADFEILSTTNAATTTSTTMEDSDDVLSVYANVEIVSDDEADFIKEDDRKLNSAAVEDQTVQSKDPPIFIKLFLRSIDVSLFVIEKSITVALPGIFKACSLMQERIEESNREGRGRNGWEALKNLGDASRRY